MKRKAEVDALLAMAAQFTRMALRRHAFRSSRSALRYGYAAGFIAARKISKDRATP